MEQTIYFHWFNHSPDPTSPLVSNLLIDEIHSSSLEQFRITSKISSLEIPDSSTITQILSCDVAIIEACTYRQLGLKSPEFLIMKLLDIPVVLLTQKANPRRHNDPIYLKASVDKMACWPRTVVLEISHLDLHPTQCHNPKQPNLAIQEVAKLTAKTIVSAMRKVLAKPSILPSDPRLLSAICEQTARIAGEMHLPFQKIEQFIARRQQVALI